MVFIKTIIYPQCFLIKIWQTFQFLFEKIVVKSKNLLERHKLILPTNDIEILSWAGRPFRNFWTILSQAGESEVDFLRHLKKIHFWVLFSIFLAFRGWSCQSLKKFCSAKMLNWFILLLKLRTFYPPPALPLDPPLVRHVLLDSIPIFSFRSSWKANTLGTGC